MWQPSSMPHLGYTKWVLYLNRQKQGTKHSYKVLIADSGYDARNFGLYTLMWLLSIHCSQQFFWFLVAQ